VASQNRFSVDILLFVGFYPSFFEKVALNAGSRASMSVSQCWP